MILLFQAYNKRCSKKGQVSIEYLLLFTAFFAVLCISLPVVSYSVDAFFVSSDVILAKKVSLDLKEAFSLFDFLSNGSSKTFQYYSSKEVYFSKKGSVKDGVLVIGVGEKEFEVLVKDAKLMGVGKYLGGFKVNIVKNAGVIELTFSNLNQS